MAATQTPTLLLAAHEGHEPTECPMCGQPLLDHDAIERVQQAERELERELDEAVSAKAAKLAKQMATAEREQAEKQIETLTQQLATKQGEATKLKAAHKQALAEQKQAHDAELRKLKSTVRAEVAAEAEKAAAAKVQRELKQKDRLISSLKDENEVQQRRIEHLTADERGEMNEEELVARLQAAFPDDRIERLGRGRAGSDILHTIRYPLDGGFETAGLVVYECKDTLQWVNSFVDQAKKARLTHKTPHVVIVSRAFPRAEKILCVRDGVPIVAPARIVDLARVLRGMVIELHRAGLSKESQAAKTQELYEYLAGDEFRQAFGVIVDAAKELGDLLGKERTAHERTWAKRQQIYNELGGKSAAIDGRLRAIIERSSSGRKAKVVSLKRTAAR